MHVFSFVYLANRSNLWAMLDVCKTEKERKQKRIRQSSCRMEKKKRARENYLLNIWNIPYCFELHLLGTWSRLRVPVYCWCGVSTLCYHFITWSFIVVIGPFSLSLVRTLFWMHLKLQWYFLCSGFMHLPSHRLNSGELITCDYYKSYYIVLFLLYKIRSSCRHFICSFHSYVVLCRLYRSTVSHTYMRSGIHSHSYSSHIFCVVGHSLMLSYVAVVHILLWNAFNQRMFIQAISKTKNNTHIHPIRRSHREATKKRLILKTTEKYRQIFTRRTNKLQELFEFLKICFIFFRCSSIFFTVIVIFDGNFIIKFSSQLPRLSGWKSIKNQ